MTPTKMTLRRVCQHTDREFTFKDGLVSICGQRWHTGAP